jgi:hypothetical protein
MFSNCWVLLEAVFVNISVVSCGIRIVACVLFCVCSLCCCEWFSVYYFLRGGLWLFVFGVWFVAAVVLVVSCGDVVHFLLLLFGWNCYCNLNMLVSQEILTKKTPA